jgi:hypothetical protein
VVVSFLGGEWGVLLGFRKSGGGLVENELRV